LRWLPSPSKSVCSVPPIALYEKFGFEIEGTHRRLAFRNGEYVDGYSMARLGS
jgi:putative acetyltransferase